MSERRAPYRTAAAAAAVPARGRTVRREAGRMNKTEQRYADEVLGPRLHAREILRWEFDSVRLRIGGRCFYETDFLVQTADGTMELHEVKGHMEDDARVKLSAVAEMYPFPVRLCRWTKATGWTIEEV